MLRTAELLPQVLAALPEFQTTWMDHMSYWGGESPGPCIDVAALSEFARDSAQAGNIPVFRRTLEVVEKLLNEGDLEVRNLLVSCFLENMLNYVSAGSLSGHTLVSHLGPLSREASKAWDWATGVKTEGL